MNLLNNSSVRRTGQSYWLASPYYYYINYASVRGVSTDGNLKSLYISAHGVRPAISLIPEIQYTSGDGSMESPYIVDIN